MIYLPLLFVDELSNRVKDLTVRRLCVVSKLQLVGSTSAHMNSRTEYLYFQHLIDHITTIKVQCAEKKGIKQC